MSWRQFTVLSLFLAPTGAQEMQIFVHLVKSVLELIYNLHRLAYDSS